MLKKQLQQYIEKASKENKINLFPEEKKYAEKHGLTSDLAVTELKSADRFAEAYIERSNKETEEVITKESAGFLSTPLNFLNENKSEFLYIESNSFDLIGAETLSLEVDDVFGTYNALFGLKLPKKLGPSLKNFLNDSLKQEMGAYSVMFNDSDGLWDVNFAFNYVEGFTENMSLGEALAFLYRFLFTLMETVEEKG